MIDQSQLKAITPGIGLGVIRFGMNRDQIKQLLGAPAEIVNEEEDSETWHYDELDLSLNFDQEENWRLVTLSITSDFYLLADKKIIGLKRDTLITLLDQLEIDDLELEEMSMEGLPAHQLISSDETMLNFWLEDGLVSEVQWGPLFFDEETIDWPEEG